MIPNLIGIIFSTQSIFWVLVITGLAIPILIYRVELLRYGGMGLATPLTAVVVLYTLMNPAAYMIDPMFALNYTLLVGDYMTADTLLPGVLCSVSFLVALLITVKLWPVRRLIDHATYLPPAPLTSYSRRKLLALSVGLWVIGSVFFIIRNAVLFGSPFGSFYAIYGGETARPYTPIFSTCSEIWGYAIMTSSILIFWQIEAKKWPKWAALIPLFLSILFAIGDGSRALVIPAVILWIGWHALRRRLRLRHLVIGIVVLSLGTLLANARYEKGRSGFLERLISITDVEYFRPFWSGDPHGVNFLLTIEALRIHDTGDVSFGRGYLEAIPSVIPTFISGGRWQSPAGFFAQNFIESQGTKYYTGTGFGYSAIIEAFENFWYVGTILLGVLCGLLCVKLMGFCPLNDQLGRALFSCFLLFIIPVISRNSVTYYIAPLMLIQIFIAWYVIWVCSLSQKVRANERSASMMGLASEKNEN